VALMEIQASRIRARLGPQGEPVLLMEQNRTLWDRLLFIAIAGAGAREALGEARGPYLLQAAIALPRARRDRGRHGLGVHHRALR